MLWLPNGAGEALGDVLATGKNLVELAGSVYYVGPTNAADASNSGLEALRPFATIGQANTTAGDDDIVVLMDGFSETITAMVTIAEKIIFAGGGQSSGQPRASLTLNAAATTMLTVSGSDVEFRNIKFPAPAQSNTSPRIILSGDDILFKDCRFEVNGFDAGSAVIRLNTGADRIRFDGCTFVNTATSVSARPCSAIGLNAGATCARVDIHNCTFDGGTVGWLNDGSGAGKDGHAVDFTGGTLTRFRGSNNTFLRGADIAFAGTELGFLQASIISGGAFVSYP